MSSGVLSRPAPCHVGNTLISRGEIMTEPIILVFLVVMATFNALLVFMSMTKGHQLGDRLLLIFANFTMISAFCYGIKEAPAPFLVIMACWFVPALATMTIIKGYRRFATARARD